jgi:hypothetical protein
MTPLAARSARTIFMIPTDSGHLGTVEAVVDAVGDSPVTEDGGKAALAGLDDALVLPTSGMPWHV